MNNKYPETILFPEAFNNANPAGYDGVFDWSWTRGCFGFTTISPMDFDGVVERYRHYLVFETKDIGKEIPKGQLITLDNLRNPKDFCVVKIWGKRNPEYWEFAYPDGKIIQGWGTEGLRDLIKEWFQKASQLVFQGRP